MADTVHVSGSDLRFLTKTYKQVAACQRVLRWAYAYGYFLDLKRDATPSTSYSTHSRTTPTVAGANTKSSADGRRSKQHDAKPASPGAIAG